MDAEMTAMLRSTVQAVFSRRTDDLARALTDEGFDEISADDEAAAFGTVFECAGSAMVADTLLDLVSQAAVGEPARILLGPSGDVQVARVVADQMSVSGVAIGGAAESYLVVTDTSRGDRVLLVDGRRLTSTPVDGLDPDLKLCRVHGTVNVASETRPTEAPTSALSALLRRCLAHQLIGLATAVAGLVHDYAATRTQFGRPLSAWQTVQHRLADVHVEIMAAEAVLAGAWCDPRAEVSAVATVQASLAAGAATAHAMQIFGAIGFTEESGLHRYVRRYHALDHLSGNGADLAYEIGSHLIADPDMEPIRVDF